MKTKLDYISHTWKTFMNIKWYKSSAVSSSTSRENLFQGSTIMNNTSLGGFLEGKIGNDFPEITAELSHIITQAVSFSIS